MAIPIKGKSHSWQRLVWRALVMHLSEGKMKIVLRPQKRMGRKIGDIRYGDLEKGQAEIRFVGDAYLLHSLGYITHEMTHVRQYVRGHLRVEDGMFLWHGKPYMSVADYAALTDFNKYKKLPWEAEALALQKTLPEQWLRGALPSLQGKDAKLDYLIDKGWLL